MDPAAPNRRRSQFERILAETHASQEDFDEETVGSRGFGILDIGYQNEKKMWAVGGSGTLLVSTDGGNSWKRERQADDLAGNLYAVRFDTPDKGFILGNDGILLRYIGKA